MLSGGGAPGIAHIGMLMALEDNNIPIDYITGTSIGAIVGGMYVLGMTPREMIQMLKSDEFKHWISGEAEPTNRYIYRSENKNPAFLEFPILPAGSKKQSLPPNFISPEPMNYAFIRLFAQAGSAAKNDFDQLFVPFRCVASDVYNKEPVVFNRGVLGDAIRASMTFPFMFKPISIDNRLLFDGGIYNNFTSDVMRKDFNPDFVIGSVVAYNTPRATEDDPILQLQNMIIHRTDYSLPAAEGLVLKFDLARIDVFDFSKVDELVRIGYDSVMKHLAEIKAHVPRRVSTGEIQERRKTFRIGFPELKFQSVSVEGVDSLQKQYIKQYFPSENKSFSSEQFKRSYYQLVSDGKIREVTPHAVFNPATGLFDLQLNVKIKPPLSLSLGGNISSSGFNQGFASLMYRKISNSAFSGDINIQAGQLYTGLLVETRWDLSSPTNWYLKASGVLHRFNYTGEKNPVDFTQNESYVKLYIGFPLNNLKARLELGAGAALLTNVYNAVNSTDQSQIAVHSTFAIIESNTLNDRMYPTEGRMFSSSIQLIDGNERFTSISNPASNFSDKKVAWFQFRAKWDNYRAFNTLLKLGTYAEIACFSRRSFTDYSTAITQAPGFQPTPFSRTVFNPAFRANQFAAVGVKPILQLTNQLQLREEVYGFIPYQSILRAADNTAYYSKPFSSVQFTNELSVVYNFKLASASLFTNYATGNWYLGLNIGVLLFNSQFGE